MVTEQTEVIGMVQAHGEVSIERAPAEVFGWIVEPDRAARWQPDVSSYEITRRTEGMVGTEFVETITGRGGKAELRGRIVAYRPDELIGFDLEGPGVRVQARYSVEPAANGTVVAADVTVEPARPVPALLRPFVRFRMRRQLERELGQLKRLCETDPPAGTRGVAADGAVGGHSS